MTEQDRNCCDCARLVFEMAPPSVVKSAAEDLLAIIDRLEVELAKVMTSEIKTIENDLRTMKDNVFLKAQLQALKEAGEPFEEFVVHMEYVRHPIDSEVLCGTRLSHYREDKDFQEITVGNIRRLDKALKEVEG